MATRTFHTDDEKEESGSESVIEDDDTDVWEDADESGGPPGFNEKEMFQRVALRPNLQHSLLTSMMRKEDGMAVIDNPASPSSRTVCQSRHRPSSPIHVSHRVPRPSKPPPPLPLSPRTTRRQMFAKELSASLRKHLYWERQDKRSTVDAALKRSSTAPSVSQPTNSLSTVQLQRREVEVLRHLARR